ncbi:MAG: hypothetical protein ABI210_12780 [Abditibacteriaceae bacterium]
MNKTKANVPKKTNVAAIVGNVLVALAAVGVLFVYSGVYNVAATK